MNQKSDHEVIGCGDYVPPGAFFEGLLRRKALTLFLEAVRTECPIALEKLESLVLPTYLRAMAVSNAKVRYRLRGMEHPDIVRRVELLKQLIQVPSSHPFLKELDESIMAWGCEFNVLGLPMAMDVALGTVAAWAHDSTLCPIGTWLLRPNPESSANKAIGMFTTVGWDPRFERRKAAAARMYQAVEDYLLFIENDIQERGWTKAPVKRHLRHFKWLAQFQVGGKPISKIGEPRERNAVKQGIDDAGELVAGEAWPGWRRKVQRGRPRHN